MKARKVTLLLLVTAISLLTIFLVVLLDDEALATDDPSSRMIQSLNVSEMPPEGMAVVNLP